MKFRQIFRSWKVQRDLFKGTLFVESFRADPARSRKAVKALYDNLPAVMPQDDRIVVVHKQLHAILDVMVGELQP